MSELFAPEVFWLTITNIGLGLVCLALIGAVMYAVVADARERRRRFPKPAMTEEADDHAFIVPGLGLTMADGGERRAAPPARPPQKG